MTIFSMLTAKKILVFVGALALLISMVFVAFRMGPLAPIKITTARADAKTLSPVIFGIGVVEAQQSWLIGPLAASRVLRVYANVGQQVKAGQLLAEIDPLDLDQRFASQEAALAKAQSLMSSAKAQ